MENKRESNLELLRIISMILIVAFHCTINIDILKGNVFEQIVLFVTGIWGVFGVDCFFIISFNFLYTSKFKMKKFINIIKQILFYTIPLLIISVISFKINTGWDILNIVKYIFMAGLKQPFWNDVYWFVTIYLLMYLSFPIMNNIIKKMNKNQLKYIVILLTMIILMYQMKQTVIEDYFFCMYMYIAFFYIKTYKEDWLKQNCKIAFVICTAFIICFKVVSVRNGANFIIDFLTGKFGRHSILFFMDSVFTFYIFKSMSIKNSSIINKLASTTFGIYLFHENQLFSVRNYMGKLSSKYNNSLLFSYFLEIILIFCIGVIIDLIRQWIFKKIDNKRNKVKDNKYEKIDTYINQLYE